MIRILVIDDVETPDSLAKLTREIEGSYGSPVEIIHLNPVGFFSGGDEAEELAAFMEIVASKATQFWDIALIDLNLSDVEMKQSELLELPLSIVATFRESNRVAMVILYSG